MNYIKNTIKNNRKVIIIYISLGIFLAFLDMFNIKLFQEILDSLTLNTLTSKLIIIYGISLILYPILL